MGSDDERMTHCHPSLTFQDGVARVVVQQPGTAALADRAVYSAGFRSCMLRLASHQPRDFEVTLPRLNDTHVVEVLIKPGLVNKLPVLRDMAANTVRSEGRVRARIIHDAPASIDPEQAVQMAKQCTIWGLVSLLLLLEGGVKVNQWFEYGADSDPSLPAQTLEAACYMDCTAVSEGVMSWLQAALQEVLATFEFTSISSAEEFAAESDCPRHWYLVQVVRSVASSAPKHCTADLFSVLTADCTPGRALERVLHLSQDLICDWVASLPQVLDLRDASLSHLQRTKLLSCLCQATDGLQTVHIPMGPAVSVLEEALQQGFCSLSVTQAWPSKWNVSIGGLCTCGRDHWAAMFSAPSCPVNSFQLNIPPLSAFASKESTPDGKISARCNPYAQAGLVPLSGFVFVNTSNAPSSSSTHSPAEMIPVPGWFLEGLRCPEKDMIQHLHALGGLMSHHTSMQHVGLHNVLLSTIVVRNLGQLLSTLPPTLTTLTLTFDKKLGGDAIATIKRPDKVLLFQSIAQLRSLKELHMRQWEDVVGADGAACVARLRGLPQLEAITVSEVKESDSFPTDMNFQTMNIAS